MMNITIDLSRFEDFSHRLPVAIKRAALKEIKNQAAMMQKHARREHRFMNSSGRRPTGRYYRNTHMLVKSIETASDETGSMVYLDTGIAKYGPYVHEGHGSWGPDQFIYDAAKQREAFIEPAVIGACQRAKDGI